MKKLDLDGITYIRPIPEGTSEWYYGVSYEHGDIYEAEEIFKAGRTVEGRRCCLIHYPDGEVFKPLVKKQGEYCGEPVYLDGSIYLLNVKFTEGELEILRFDCSSHTVESFVRLPLDRVKDCYNLSLCTSPLTLTRQKSADNEFEILWPEQAAFRMDDHDSFFLRIGSSLLFNRWHEDERGYTEETVIRDLNGNEVDRFPGDVRIMPNGEIWFLQ